MSTLYDNLVVQQVVAGNALNASSWYSYVDSSGTCQASYEGSDATHTGASDAHILLSEINAALDSEASPESDSYTTDASGNTANAFVIDGDDILTYSSTNIIKNNIGSIAFLWKAPLPYNKYVDDFYLIFMGGGGQDFMQIHYSVTDSKFYFSIYNGTNWSTARAISSAQTFVSEEWLKIAVTWSVAAATTMSIYINSSTAQGTYGSSWTKQTVPATIYVGGYHTSTSQSDGAFDELRIYSEALTSAKIETLFNDTWSWA